VKYFGTLVCLFLLAGNALAQVNLVPNGDFEIRENCPIYGSSLHECPDWDDIYGSVDHFHLCGTSGGNAYGNEFGGQTPLDSGYIGFGSYTTFFAGGQEVANAILTQPLVQGVKYRVRFKASYADSANYAICCVGIILSDSPPPQGPYFQNLNTVELVLEESDFDTTTWFQYDGVYTAQGGEDKIYVGSFRPEADMNPIHVRPNGDPNYNIAYWYIDDVEVYEDDLVGIEQEILQVKLNSELVSEQLEITTDKPVHLYLMDISGRMVLSEQLNLGRSSISVSSTPNGMYVAVFTSENGQTTSKKIVKVN
jgi:hypothetical protein